MIDLDALAKTSYEIAKEKGWWDKPRSFSAMYLLKVSEISEALEDYRANRPIDQIHYEADGKVCGFPSEIADVFIRIGDFFARYEQPLGATLEEYRQSGNYLRADYQNVENALAFSTYELAMAFERWAFWVPDGDLSFPSDGTSEVFFHMAGALDPLFQMCEANNIPLERAIEEKTAYNRKRAYRHGGKLI